MKKITKLALAVFATSLSLTAIGDGAPAGKQLFGKIYNNEYVVTNEVDPVFSEWKNGNNYVSKVFTNGHEVAVNNNQINLVLPAIPEFDWKLDATNGVAFGTLYVLPEEVPGGNIGDGHAILDNEGLRFTTTTTAPDITYSLNGISALYGAGNEQWYRFDNTTNGISRLKDIPTITTNNVPVEVKDGKVEIPLHKYVLLEDLQDGITFDNLSATNLTVNGKQVSVEGHKHVVEDITDLKGLWSIPGADVAASNAIDKIERAQNMNEVKNAMIEFLQNLKKPTE